MDEQLIEQFAEALERLAVQFGAENYEAGLERAVRTVSRALELLESIRTKDELRKKLRTVDLESCETQKIVMYSAFQLPAMVKMSVETLAERFTSGLPRVPTGRNHKASRAERTAIIQYALKLYGQQKISLSTAKRRAAQKFGVSVRTVERYFAKREMEEPSIASVSDVRDWISRQFLDSSPQRKEDVYPGSRD